MKFQKQERSEPLINHVIRKEIFIYTLYEMMIIE